MTPTNWIELVVGVNFVIVGGTIGSYLFLLRRVLRHLKRLEPPRHPPERTRL